MNTDISLDPDSIDKDALLNELARRCGDVSNNEVEIARLTYVLRSLNLGPSVIVKEMHRRHTHSISTSWVVRLVRIYDWWVVRNGYDAHTVFRYSKNKLYAMALCKESSWEYLVANGEKSDKDFMADLRVATGNPPELAIISIPHVVREELRRLSARLSQMTGTTVGIIPAIEFAVEVANSMSPETLQTLWQAAHGELDSMPKESGHANQSAHAA